jgi:hypothetical protein
MLTPTLATTLESVADSLRARLPGWPEARIEVAPPCPFTTIGEQAHICISLELDFEETGGPESGPSVSVWPTRWVELHGNALTRLWEMRLFEQDQVDYMPDHEDAWSQPAHTIRLPVVRTADQLADTVAGIFRILGVTPQ